MKRIIKASVGRPFLRSSLILIAVALCPRAQAVVPAPDGGYPGGNTGEGQNALFSLTSGGYNTAIGFFSLRSNTTGNFNTAIGAGTLLANTGDENTATGAAALLSNSTGPGNTADGAFALFSNTTGGFNTAIGNSTLFSNTTGGQNAATGVDALTSNTSGTHNTGNGVSALANNIDGNGNTATGSQALFSNTTSNNNTATGLNALLNNTTGSFNIAMGSQAGTSLTTGDYNIDIGSSGVPGESGTIRIGNTNRTATYIAGIAGQTVGNGGTTCYVDNDGKLGVFLSARRFKTDVADMGNASEALLALRPVTFHYKHELDKTGIPQFGLVAEEVAAVNPDLVTHDAKGELSTVRYEAINAMLLNEFLKEHCKAQQQEATIAHLECMAEKQEATNARQQQQIEGLTTGLQKVSAEIEETRLAPQTILNED